MAFLHHQCCRLTGGPQFLTGHSAESSAHGPPGADGAIVEEVEDEVFRAGRASQAHVMLPPDHLPQAQPGLVLARVELASLPARSRLGPPLRHVRVCWIILPPLLPPPLNTVASADADASHTSEWCSLPRGKGNGHVII
jgi:hypothetical protein